MQEQQQLREREMANPVYLLANDTSIVKDRDVSINFERKSYFLQHSGPSEVLKWRQAERISILLPLDLDETIIVDEYLQNVMSPIVGSSTCLRALRLYGIRADHLPWIISAINKNTALQAVHLKFRKTVLLNNFAEFFTGKCNGIPRQLTLHVSLDLDKSYVDICHARAWYMSSLRELVVYQPSMSVECWDGYRNETYSTHTVRQGKNVLTGSTGTHAMPFDVYDNKYEHYTTRRLKKTEFEFLETNKNVL